MHIARVALTVALVAGSFALGGWAWEQTDELYTHCGIDELSHDGKWYVRDGGPLTDGNSNPPPGWGNPFQRGHVTIDGHRAVFSDTAGHHESFTERPGATGPLTVCS